MRHGGLGRDTNLEGDGRHAGEREGELGDNDGWGDVENLGVEGGAVIVYDTNAKTIREGLHVELGQESSLGGTNLLASLDEVDGVGDLDLTLGDLGGDLQNLEEACLSWVASGGSGRDVDVFGSNSTHTGRGRDAVGKNHVSDVSQATVGEDESDVSGDGIQQIANRMLGVLLQEIIDDSADKGVLSHENLGSSSHHDTSGVQLLGADVINLDNKHLVVGLE